MNLFALPLPLPVEEEFTDLLVHPHFRVERIVSAGQSSPPGFWYDQEWHEWVVVLQGSACIAWADGTRREMVAGDSVMIPAHVRHRVEATSRDPVCIWLAVHYRMP